MLSICFFAVGVLAGYALHALRIRDAVRNMHRYGVTCGRCGKVSHAPWLGLAITLDEVRHFPGRCNGRDTW